MKKFLLEDIPPELHQSWKIYAAVLGISMKDFCLVALTDMIKNVKESGKDGQ